MDDLDEKIIEALREFGQVEKTGKNIFLIKGKNGLSFPVRIIDNGPGRRSVIALAGFEPRTEMTGELWKQFETIPQRIKSTVVEILKREEVNMSLLKGQVSDW